MRKCTKYILIYKTFHMPASVQFPFINLKSTWKCAHLDQPHIPPSTRLTINGQCKPPHGYFCIVMSLLISGSLRWITATTERKTKKRSFCETDGGACGRGGPWTLVPSSFFHSRSPLAVSVHPPRSMLRVSQQCLYVYRWKNEMCERHHYMYNSASHI